MSKNNENKGNLSTKLFFPQNDKNALTTFLHSTDDFTPHFCSLKESLICLVYRIK